MGGRLNEDELRRLQEFSDTPRYRRTPEMLLPDEESDDDEPDE